MRETVRLWWYGSIFSRHDRMCLGMGGDDITEFLHVLLEKISFPYRELNLARSYDWSVMEDLKARLCTLAEVSVLIHDAFVICLVRY